MATTATKKKDTETTTTEKKRFTTAFVGKTPAGPFAFHLEGNLTRPSELKTLPSGGTVVNNSIGVGRSAFALFALGEGTYDKTAQYPENNFVEISAFNGVAERMAELPKGTRIVVSGKMSKRTWKDKAGAEHEGITVDVDDFAVLSCKAHDKGVPAKATVPATNMYTNKAGEEKALPVACLVSGNLFSVDELGTGASGNAYLHFSIFAQEPAQKVLDKARGVDISGKEYEEKRNLIRCSVFGRQAEAMAKLLKKGMAVAVSGTVSENVFEGKSSVQMSVNALNVISFETATGTSAVIPLPEDAGDAPVDKDAPASGEVDPEFIQGDDDDDDELPF